ncbi:MAG: hypothetical protein FD181_1466 [Prolixibacteraceae bacterium]|nr:MAG: hypothetical protein FD181_1466 [Prolixibacteraceae bacterium]
MKRKLKILILNILFISCITQDLLAEMNFVSNKVKEVYSTLPVTAKEFLQSNGEKNNRLLTFQINTGGQKFDLNARFNDYKELEHIGINLFKENENLFEIKEVFDYIERSFLISIIANEKYFLENQQIKDDIELIYNGTKISPQNKLTAQTAINVVNNSQLNIKYNSDAFLIGWKTEQNSTLWIRIPNNYSVITGQTKDELEKNLLRKIKNLKMVKIDNAIPQKSQLKKVSENIYYLPGQMYSTTPELSSAKYFLVTDAIVPVFDKSHYKESVRNLFLNLVNSKIELSLVQKMYGGTDEKFNININHFNANFTDDFDIYFGWQNDDKEYLKASVFFSHKIYNYNHLLIITSNFKSIFKKDAEIDGIFMAYIPREKQLNPD